MGDLDKAEEDISSVSGNIKNDTEPLIILSAIYIKKKNLDEAMKILAKAESISPNDPVILYQIGSIYYYRDDPKYISYFDRLHDATAGKQTDEYAKYMKAFKLLITAHFEKKNYSRVVEISDVMLKNSKDHDIILMSGKSCYYTGKYDLAIERLGKISLKRGDELFLALAYAHSGKKERSVEILKRIITDSDIRKDAMKDPLLKSYIEEVDRQNNQNLNLNKTP